MQMMSLILQYLTKVSNNLKFSKLWFLYPGVHVNISQVVVVVAAWKTFQNIQNLIFASNRVGLRSWRMPDHRRDDRRDRDRDRDRRKRDRSRDRDRRGGGGGDRDRSRRGGDRSEHICWGWFFGRFRRSWKSRSCNKFLPSCGIL